MTTATPSRLFLSRLTKIQKAMYLKIPIPYLQQSSTITPQGNRTFAVFLRASCIEKSKKHWHLSIIS